MSEVRRQKIAIEQPCFAFENMGLPRFREDQSLRPGFIVTTVLTVDLFDNQKMWHAMAALQCAPQVFIPFDELSRDEIRLLCRKAIGLVTGVGVEATQYAERQPHSFHVLRMLTDAEYFQALARRSAVVDVTLYQGHIDTIGLEQARFEYGVNADKIIQSQS